MSDNKFVLYRKYRPKTFDDVLGQEHDDEYFKRVVDTLRESNYKKVWCPITVSEDNMEQIAEAYCDEAGINFEILEPDTLEPFDILGIKKVDKDRGISTDMPMSYMQKLADEGGILYIPDITNTNPAMQSILLSIITERKVGNIDLSKVTIISPITKDADTSCPNALLNRLSFTIFSPDTLIIKDIEKHWAKEKLQDFAKSEFSPRSVTEAGKLLGTSIFESIGLSSFDEVTAEKLKNIKPDESLIDKYKDNNADNSDAFKLFDAMQGSNMVPCLMSKPGYAMSSVVSAYGNARGKKVISLYTAGMEASDIHGIPYSIDGVTKFAPIEEFVALCDGGGILFLDQLNNANYMVQAAVLNMITEHKIGEVEMKNVQIIAASNSSDDATNAYDFTGAMLARLSLIDYMDMNAIRGYIANTSDLTTEQKAWILAVLENEDTFPISEHEKATKEDVKKLRESQDNLTPRTAEQCSDIYYNEQVDEDTKQKLIVGIAGQKMWDILVDTKNKEIPKTNPYKKQDFTHEDALGIAGELGDTVVFIGSPGTGKTKSVEAWAKKQGRPMTTIIAQGKDAPDFNGYFSKSEDGKHVDYNPLADLVKANEESGVVFLDGYNNATPDVRLAIMKIIRTRKIKAKNGKVIRLDNIQFVIAVNEQHDAMSATEWSNNEKAVLTFIPFYNMDGVFDYANDNMKRVLSSPEFLAKYKNPPNALEIFANEGLLALEEDIGMFKGRLRRAKQKGNLISLRKR